MATAEPTPSERGVLAAASCLLVALPFLAVRFPPITDLPQHTAQIRLFLEALHHPDGPYTIQWLTPYSLGYLSLGAAWTLVGPDSAGRLGMLGIELLSVGATHLLAAARGRSPAAATLAATLLFSHVVYWGFVPFAAGWPVFVGWLLLTTGDRARRARPADLGLLLAAALTLYLSHALWFAVGALWLLVHGLASSLVGRVPPRTVLLRLASVAPVLALAAVWFPRLATHAFSSPTVWAPSPLQRLEPRWLIDAAFGGLTGPLESLVSAAIAGWLLVGAWQARDRLGSAVDRECLLAALLLFALGLFLPGQYTRTIRFAERWMPYAVMLLLLAAPPLRLRRRLAATIALSVLTVFSGTTLITWLAVERTSLSGLPASLAALPPAPRLLGLDWVRFNPGVNQRPFVHLAAYGQVLRGGTLGVSLADLAPSLVTYAPPRARPWTERLEWRPERLRATDLQYFDYVLAGGDEVVHRQLARYLQPVTTEGVWRLYRVSGTKG